MRCGNSSSPASPQPATASPRRSQGLRTGTGRGAAPFRPPVAASPGATRQQPQGGERHHGERDRLHHRELVFAVQPGGDDLRRHHPEAAAEDVGRAERRERRHEREKRRAGERGIEVRQHHAPERAPPARAETGRRLVLRGVERGEGRAHEEIEVDVHRVGVHQQDRAGALEPPRRVGETERALDQQRDEPGLAVEEQERDDADERREHGRQRHQRASTRPPGNS